MEVVEIYEFEELSDNVKDEVLHHMRVNDWFTIDHVLEDCYLFEIPYTDIKELFGADYDVL